MEALSNAAILVEDKRSMAAENCKRRMMQQGGSSNPRVRPAQPPRLAPPLQRNLYSAPRPNYPNKKKPDPRPNAPTPTPGQRPHSKISAPRRSTNAANGRLVHVNAEESQEDQDVVMGTFLVNSVPAKVLFDSGAS